MATILHHQVEIPPYTGRPACRVSSWREHRGPRWEPSPREPSLAVFLSFISVLQIGYACKLPHYFSNQSGGFLLLSHSHPEVEGAEFVVFTDPSRRYVDCTDGVCRLLDYDRSEMLARSIEHVSFHDGEVWKPFAEYLRRGKMGGEFVLRHKDGKPRPIRYRAFLFTDGCAAAVWEPIKACPPRLIQSSNRCVTPPLRFSPY